MKRLLPILLLALAAAVSADELKELKSLIVNAAKSGSRSVKLEPRVYKLDGKLVLSSLRDFTIDGNGATLLFTDPLGGLVLQNSADLALSDFTIDYDPLPFTQATITGIERNTVLFRLHDGYPDFPRRNRINTHFFDRESRNWKKGVKDYFGMKIDQTAVPREYRLKLPGSVPPQLAVGDLMAFDWREGRAIYATQVNNLRLTGITIHAAPSIAIIGRFNSGKHHLEKITIARGKRPAGASEERLLSSCADGVNYAYNEHGPDIIGCDFSYLGDDSINFHSVAFPIVKVEDAGTILVMRPYSRESFPAVVKPGMELRLLDGNDFRILGRATVAKFEAAPEFTVPDEQANRLFTNHNARKSPERSVYRIRLTGKLPAAAEELFVDIPALSGAGYVIRDNYFHDQRARAIRMMASDGVIENNRIERIKQNAITIGGEYAFWREAGWVENVTVRNNRIKDVGLDERLTSPGSYAPGAISLFMRPEPGVTSVPSGNRNIVIENNLIDGCSGVGIVLHAVDGATVRGNIIRNVGYGDLANAGKEYGFRLSKPIETTSSAINVKVSENEL